MSRKSQSLELIILLPEELGALIKHLRTMRACEPETDEWAIAVSNALNAADVAFAHAVASKSDAVLLALGSPTLCKVQQRGDKGPSER